MSLTLLYELLIATGETLYMVIISTLLAVILGLPLGTLLFSSKEIKPSPILRWILEGIININRSIPFIILLVALIPLTRLLIGTSIGINAAIVPLTIGATPFFARLVKNGYENLPKGLIETGFSMGATSWQMIRFFLLPEAFCTLIQATTVTAVTLINYSAMAGTIGAGGLGDLAIRYGYQRFNTTMIIMTVIILIILVHLVQIIGDFLIKRFSHF